MRKSIAIKFQHYNILHYMCYHKIAFILWESKIGHCSLVQTITTRLAILLSNEKLVFIQTNSRMLKSMGIDDVIQELNPDEIAITKVHSLPNGNWRFVSFFVWETKFNHLNMCHGNKNLRVWGEFWPCQLLQMNYNGKKHLLQAKAFLKQANWKPTFIIIL